MNAVRLWLMALILGVVQSVWAETNQRLVYTGRILKPDGTPLQSSNVQFKIGIFTPGSEECLLYEETQNVNMSGSQGTFSLEVGSGTRTGGYLASQLETVFQNDSPFTGLTCGTGSTFDPTAADANTDRILKVSFTDGTTTVALSPQPIKAVPYALHSRKASEAFDVTGTANISSLILRNSSNNQISILAPSAGFTNYGLTLPPALPGSGQTGYLTVNSAGVLSFNTATLGTGSVTSVDVAVPSYMTSSGGPVTTSGSITLGFGSQAAGTVFAAPSGTAGAPSFRALTTTDIPDLSGTYLLPSAIVATAPLAWNAGTKTMSVTLPTCAPGTVLSSDGTDFSCVTDSTLTNAFVNGGNAFGAATSLGTTDGQNLNLKANNIVSMTLDTDGNVGVGTTADTNVKLDVEGQIRSKVFDAGASTTIDWSRGNTQYTSANCGNFTFSNMMEGGTYTLIVRGTSPNTCTFSQTAPDTLSTGSFQFIPANGLTINGKKTVFTFTRAAGEVYTSWLPF